MKLKTFTASTMAEALALVKSELGAGAVILHTRKYKRGGLLGLGAREVVEITAADEAHVPPRRTAKPAPERRPQQSQTRPSPRSGGPSPSEGRGGGDAGAAARTAGPEPTAGDLIRRTYAAAKIELAREAVEREKAAPAALAPSPAAALVAATVPGPAPYMTRIETGPDLVEEMRAMHRMVARVVRHQRIGHVPPLPPGEASPAGASGAMPGKLFDQYLSLLKQEVAEELAEEVVHEVEAKLTPAQLEDAETVRRAVRECIARLIPTDDGADQPEPTGDGRPRTIALIGPTGVGKTTTIAKLAATFKLKQKKSVGLITLDTYRIAAVEQLRTYASIIGVPLHVAVSPEELSDALRKCAAAKCDVVLIDTAGRSQRDDPRLEQLRAFVKAADPHEVHLVLSSTCTQSVLMDTVERFSAIRTDRIIFTKLDEAVSLGVLLNVSRKAKKRLSYVTTGQEVPHQIEPGRPERLARLVMGGEAR